MIWDGRGYHMAGDMTPLTGITLSIASYTGEILVSFFIKRPVEGVMMYIIGYNINNKISAQIISRGDLKVWS